MGYLSPKRELYHLRLIRKAFRSFEWRVVILPKRIFESIAEKFDGEGTVLAYGPARTVYAYPNNGLISNLWHELGHLVVYRILDGEHDDRPIDWWPSSFTEANEDRMEALVNYLTGVILRELKIPAKERRHVTISPFQYVANLDLKPRLTSKPVGVVRQFNLRVE